MVDAVTLGALNRIIRNNALTFAAITATTGVFSGNVTGSKFIESTIETATSSAVTLSNGGISGIGTTNAATTFVIAAPVAGVSKYIYQNITSTQAQTVFTGSSLITIIGLLNPTAASSITRITWGSSLATGTGVELSAISATQWAIRAGVGSTAITMTT
jgi:hypothetical protein